jgi:protein-tyrosine phosphatase
VIDLHCHILPGLDDGPVEMADSVEMAEQADADGIEIVCATPHIRWDHDVRIAELSERVDMLNAELAARGAGARVVVGGEVAETAAEGLEDAELELVSLGGSGGWVLLEPAPGPLSGSLADAVDRLAARGCRSVIAHPERHLSPDMVERLLDLIGRGALVQATAALFEGDDDAARYMLGLADRGVVHVLGSDSHSPRIGRPVRISPALERLRGVSYVAPHLEWIAERAPRAIVRGEQLEPPFRPRG